jgi:hypothetical protein
MEIKFLVRPGTKRESGRRSSLPVDCATMAVPFLMAVRLDKFLPVLMGIEHYSVAESLKYSSALNM